ncbi:class I SAM-dependent methyltransferase [archaeon]|nr:MAG: class I SAM-dependent methyltransferase [archaeon]
MKEVLYYENDFNWDEWATHCDEEFKLPEITINPDTSDLCTDEKDQQATKWEQLFSCHVSGSLYKRRNYLYKEFSAHLADSLVLMELGCGYGSSVFALLPHLAADAKVWAVDHSSEALRILQCHPDYDPERIECVKWSMAALLPTEPPDALTHCAPDTILLVFSLSAILPHEHVTGVRNIKALLSRSGGRGLVLFRDYGMHDMTMYRHQQRLSDLTFQRKDGTLCHYFTVEYVAALFTGEGFAMLECKYATVINKNRKQEKTMHRVFVHAVFALVL